jgi:hypothetical protein
MALSGVFGADLTAGFEGCRCDDAEDRRRRGSQRALI